MKIDVSEDGILVFKEVFNSIILETQEGNRFAVCMRDSGLEIGVVDKSLDHQGIEEHLKWYAAKDGGIRLLGTLTPVEKLKVAANQVKNQTSIPKANGSLPEVI